MSPFRLTPSTYIPKSENRTRTPQSRQQTIVFTEHEEADPLRLTPKVEKSSLSKQIP